MRVVLNKGEPKGKNIGTKSETQKLNSEAAYPYYLGFANHKSSASEKSEGAFFMLGTESIWAL